MTKTISESQGTIGERKKSNSLEKKRLEKNVRLALIAASHLMKDVISRPNPTRMNLCLDLKRKLEELEREYGVNLI